MTDLKQVQVDLAKLQNEVDRLTREKLEDRLRIITLEQAVAKENHSSSQTVTTFVETSKFVLQSVTSHAVPALTSFSSSLVKAAQSLMSGRKRKRRRAVTIYSSQVGSEKFL
jgi:hypothetical protein